MADEDNFDIDIYGDGEGMDEDSKEFYKQENQKNIALRGQQPAESLGADSRQTPLSQAGQVDGVNEEGEPPDDGVESETKPKPQQGVKRKGDSDERRIDAGATTALLISDLHWWTTEDDVRGWVNEADAEDELKDITFSEHKVNGKSKGQAFIEFSSPQASTAAKSKVESLSGGLNKSRKFSVVFTNASSNPFKTLPKDAPARTKDDRIQRSTSASHSAPAHHNNYTPGNNFRGGRGGGYNNRGGYNQGYSNNRNFSSSGNMGAFNGGPGFQGNMPLMNNFNNFGGRGAMMGNNMRGNMNGMRGRGGITNGMMPMGMMGGMGMGMGMNPMMAGMGGPGFGAGPQFNSAMFNQNNSMNNMNNNYNQGMKGGDWSHGAKRQRQD